MKLSYSLIDHFQACQFRTKVFDFDRVRGFGEGARDAFSSLVGQLAHEGQAALFHNADPLLAIDEFIARREEKRPLELPEGWDRTRLVERCAGMVSRFAAGFESFDYRRLEPVLHQGTGLLVDARLEVPINVGIFDTLVVKADLVADDENDLRWLYDWKWSAELTDPDWWSFDLQSAVYQWGLAQLGIEVRGHAIVQGLIEEPTAFRTNKDGSVSKRAVRNSYEEYVRACNAAQCDVDESMRDRLLPFFRHSRNFRSRKEVEATWRQTVVPIAEQISRAYERDGFTRRLSKGMCGRCILRDDCLRGQLGQHELEALNTIHPVKKEA